ncbi:hypothetical protein AMAG_03513 [Allomyces macrogynus ATCC 38327]|uniref:F-box domain-containing protein n=1 Tax=Allomyces macrogynus (strain ATCC 38327) TaxID=578462 RepID=A0A0L0S9A3_ALLM3|nr:hypothetical protein AMAG_03513 [Allomyces macrogynus ATCC 38327]|eukprot:KNE59188.1 hypothetical protein AMAG_03513 [Allomyces macrogynus ATCC 38327]
MLPRRPPAARPPGSSSQPAGHAAALPDPWRLAKCAALARAAAHTSATAPAAGATPPALLTATTRSNAFNRLPTEIIVLILARVIGVESLESFLACRAVTRRCRKIVEGTHLNTIYRSLLSKWKVKAQPHARARKYKAFFSLVMRELHAGRACHLRHIDTLRWTNSAKFYALPRRAIVGLDAPYNPILRMTMEATTPSKIYQSHGVVLNNGHGHEALATKTRKYELPVVERIMAAWTRRTEPPINLAVDWRALDEVKRGGVGNMGVAVGGGGEVGGGVQGNVIVMIDSSEDEAEFEAAGASKEEDDDGRRPGRAAEIY